VNRQGRRISEHKLLEKSRNFAGVGFLCILSFSHQKKVWLGDALSGAGIAPKFSNCYFLLIVY